MPDIREEDYYKSLLENPGGEGAEAESSEKLPEVEKNFRKALEYTLHAVQEGGLDQHLSNGGMPPAPGRLALTRKIETPYLEAFARSKGFDKLTDPQGQQNEMSRYMWAMSHIVNQHTPYDRIERNQDIKGDSTGEFQADAYTLLRLRDMLNLDVGTEGIIPGSSVKLSECIGSGLTWTELHNKPQYVEKLAKGENLTQDDAAKREKIQQEIAGMMPYLQAILAHYYVQELSRSEVFVHCDKPFQKSLNGAEQYNSLQEELAKWGYYNSRDAKLDGLPVPKDWNSDPEAHKDDIAALKESWLQKQLDAAQEAVVILESGFKELDGELQAYIAKRTEIQQQILGLEPDTEAVAVLEGKIAALKNAQDQLRTFAGNTQYTKDMAEQIRSTANIDVFSEEFTKSLKSLVELFDKEIPKDTRLFGGFLSSEPSPKLQRTLDVNKGYTNFKEAIPLEIQHLSHRVDMDSTELTSLKGQNEETIRSLEKMTAELRTIVKDIPAKEKAAHDQAHALETVRVLITDIGDTLHDITTQKKAAQEKNG